MNILVFGEASWDDKNAFGNTMSNFFDGKIWNNDLFSCFYTRERKPDNKLNINYYNISAIGIVKGMLSFGIKGKKFNSQDILANDNSLKFASGEQALINKIHKKSNNALHFFHETIWRTKLWISRDFKKFIKNNNPEILFSFCQSQHILLPLIKYLKKTNCKVVLFLADDIYGSFCKLPKYRGFLLKKELRKCLSLSDKVYGITDEICDSYSKMFGKQISVLHKGCVEANKPNCAVNEPKKIVYAGNLLYGREEILYLIATALESINVDGVKAQLEIYTNTAISANTLKKMKSYRSCSVFDSKPYDEIKKIMKYSDICLHVESFEPNYASQVRYSFSTKITDCLQSGNNVLAIGPSDIASIGFLKKVGGVTVIDDLSRLKDDLELMIDDDKRLLEDRVKIQGFVQENLLIDKIQRRLRDDFATLCKSEEK